MKYAWMPVFWGDFLANTMHLSAQEVGAYFLLIAHAWENDALVPCDKAQRIARVNNYHWAKVRTALEPFFELRGGTSEVLPRMYYHARVHQELTSAAKLSNKRTDAALQMHANRRANAEQMHTPSPSPSLESSNGKGREAQPMQMHRPQPTAAWHPRIDEADDYRAPPAKKSDNDLNDPSRADLKVLAKRRS